MLHYSKLALNHLQPSHQSLWLITHLPSIIYVCSNYYCSCWDFICSHKKHWQLIPVYQSYQVRFVPILPGPIRTNHSRFDISGGIWQQNNPWTYYKDITKMFKVMTTCSCLLFIICPFPLISNNSAYVWAPTDTVIYHNQFSSILSLACRNLQPNIMLNEFGICT